MEITNIQIKPIISDSKNRLRAIASFVIDDCIAVHDIKIIEGSNGLFIAMPSKTLPNGNFNDIVHPINTKTREMLSKALLDAYNECISSKG